MKQLTRFFRMSICAIAAVFVCSCELLWPDPSRQDTADGHNTLSFTINGKRVSSWYTYHIEYFSAGYGWINEPRQEMGVFTSSRDSNFRYLALVIPLDQLHSGVDIHPEVYLSYFQNPRKGYLDIQLATISSSTLTIRRLDEKQHIFAGNFTMTGSYIDQSGQEIPFDVSDGRFDVQYTSFSEGQKPYFFYEWESYGLPDLFGGEP